MAKTYQAPLAQNFGTLYTGTCDTVMGSVNTRVWDANCAEIIEATTEDIKIGRLVFKATGQVPATNVVVFISDVNGTNFEPFVEVILASAGVTPSATVPSSNVEISYNITELYLRVGQILGFGITATCITGKIVGWAVLGEY